MVGDDELLEALGAALRPAAGPGPAPARVTSLRARVPVRTGPLPRRTAGLPARTSTGPTPGRARVLAFAASDRPRGPSRPAEALGWVRPRWAPALRYATVAAVVGVLLGTAGGTISARQGSVPVRMAAVPEFDGPLESATDRAVTGRAAITRTGAGRVVRIEDDELPDLPAGGFYEAWLIGPMDAPGRPQRISAGTFHPDDQGWVGVDLLVAVDPARYPDLAITAEPADGDPAPSAEVVRRARIRPA